MTDKQTNEQVELSKETLKRFEDKFLSGILHWSKEHKTYENNHNSHIELSNAQGHRELMFDFVHFLAQEKELSRQEALDEVLTDVVGEDEDRNRPIRMDRVIIDGINDEKQRIRAKLETLREE